MSGPSQQVLATQRTPGHAVHKTLSPSGRKKLLLWACPARCALSLDVWGCIPPLPRSTTSSTHGVSWARHPWYAFQCTQPSLTGHCPSHRHSVSETIRRRKRTLGPGVTVALNGLWICRLWCGDRNGPHLVNCVIVCDDARLGVGCVSSNRKHCRLARVSWQLDRRVPGDCVHVPWIRRWCRHWWHVCVI